MRLPVRHAHNLVLGIGFSLCVLLAGCGSGPDSTRDTVRADETTEPWYSQTVAELVAKNRESRELYKVGNADAAAAIMEEARLLTGRLLAVRTPTLEAMQAASDLDDLHGRMLLANHHYGWARLLFQKNVARWKNVQPRTEDSLKRWKEAEAAIAECDRNIPQ